MSTGIPISDAASMAMHSMAYIASRHEPSSVHNISERLGVSEFHLSKVLQRLSKRGLVRSNRGPKGGFTLYSDPDSITLMDVYEAIDGPLNDSPCLMRSKTCGSTSCILGDTMQAMQAMFRKRLTGTRISDITDSYRSEAS